MLVENHDLGVPVGILPNAITQWYGKRRMVMLLTVKNKDRQNTRM